MNFIELIFEILRSFSIINDPSKLARLQRRAEDWYTRTLESDNQIVKFLMHTISEGWFTQTLLACYSIKLKKDVATYLAKVQEVADGGYDEEEDDDYDDEEDFDDEEEEEDDL